jgi:hypothetical protein
VSFGYFLIFLEAITYLSFSSQNQINQLALIVIVSKSPCLKNIAMVPCKRFVALYIKSRNSFDLNDHLYHTSSSIILAN